MRASAKTIRSRAHEAVFQARSHKALIEPDKCPQCGRDDVGLHAHHNDYKKPLDIIWCCPKCHWAIHKKLGWEAPGRTKGKKPKREKVALCAYDKAKLASHLVELALR